jgi:hypothetical protein
VRELALASPSEPLGRYFESADELGADQAASLSNGGLVDPDCIRGKPHSIEAFRILENGRVAAQADVVEDRIDRRCGICLGACRPRPRNVHRR